ALNDTSFIQHLNPVLAAPFKVGFSQAMDFVFLLGAAVLVVALLFTLFLPQVPLRTQSALAAREPASPLGERPGIAPLGPPGAHPELTGAAAAGSAAGAPAAPAVSPDGRTRVPGARLRNRAVLTRRVSGPDPPPPAGAA